ncbi:hypothetical protein K439DRAFT_1611689 [Ramaria rubella]|nr:hypothetical protein K439DRAFT_1611689 [Ramaria rubella]
MSRWPTIAPFAFWADHVTVWKATGYSPFYMVHGIELILPFNITEATFLISKLERPLNDEELIAIRVQQLEKRDGDLADIHEWVLKACYTSIAQFEKDHEHTIHDYDFKPGLLILVQNTQIEMDHSRKCKPCYQGPMVMVR